MATVIGHVTHDKEWTYEAAGPVTFDPATGEAIQGKPISVTVPAGDWSVLDCGCAVPGTLPGGRLEYERDGTPVRVPGEEVVGHDCSLQEIRGTHTTEGAT